MRRLPVFVALALLVLAAACSKDNDIVEGGGVIDGPPRADVNDEPPYGAGVKVGSTYDYTLYTHCGVEWARIDGVWWQTSTPLNDAKANLRSGWGDPFHEGQIEVVDDSTALFRGGPTELKFTRTETTDPPFLCG